MRPNSTTSTPTMSGPRVLRISSRTTVHPRLLKMLDIVSNPCLHKTPSEALVSIRPRRKKKISTVDFPRTTGMVRVRYVPLNRHVNLSEMINEDMRIQVANSHSHSAPSTRIRTSIVKEQHHQEACRRHIHRHSSQGKPVPYATPPIPRL